MFSFFFFFNDTATTEIYTLSLHDALPISILPRPERGLLAARPPDPRCVLARRGLQLHRHDLESEARGERGQDRKSTRLNSSHGYISYAVFCLKKKKNI